MNTEGQTNTAELEGFAQFYLELLEGFRRVAVDNHLGGDGRLSELNTHIRGVVDEQTLLNQYELPVIMTTPTPLTTNRDTINLDNGTFTFQAVVWTGDEDPALGQIIALEDAIRLAGNVVTNVERNRTLKVDGIDQPLAEDTGISDFSPDFSFAGDLDYALKYCKVDFDISYKRKVPRGKA
jgi:hypothetical protein